MGVELIAAQEAEWIVYSIRTLHAYITASATRVLLKSHSVV